METKRNFGLGNSRWIWAAGGVLFGFAASSATGTGLATYIAVACRGDNNSGTSITSAYHYNMPP